MHGVKLKEGFFRREDVVQVSKELLGKVLVTNINGHRCSGLITETEAYAGITDRASHAYGNKRTRRTDIMYGKGGISYVYLCYGLHHLFNIVTNTADVPHAVLIRALHPIEGLPAMLERRRLCNDFKPGKNGSNRISGGPGTLSQAMGMRVTDSGTSLQENRIWVEDRGLAIEQEHISAAPRIGVDFAGKDALLPYRFTLDHAKSIL